MYLLDGIAQNKVGGLHLLSRRVYSTLIGRVTVALQAMWAAKMGNENKDGNLCRRGLVFEESLKAH